MRIGVAALLCIRVVVYELGFAFIVDFDCLRYDWFVFGLIVLL